MLLAYFWGPPHPSTQSTSPPGLHRCNIVSLVGPCDDSDFLRRVCCRRAKPFSLLCVVRDVRTTAAERRTELTGIFVDLLPLSSVLYSNGAKRRHLLVLSFFIHFYFFDYYC